ncbi:4-coumarate--CoA ligase 1 [Anoplophora glabripennis]|uniref:4-coumarate--CoA ligase 1 n=1 Tax=Anoplophora glabripennis TaxID=217634 RepID=UPI0008750D1F|nr:4-coumarate--CoA ligase 1 [Anoplophora glabripennis]XP_018575537.1 4-coumarate--CoA ligase 1 [Anoplophora glabripennis]
MFSIEDNIIKTEDIVFDAKSLGGVGKVFFNCMKKNGSKIAQTDAATDQSDSFESLLQRSVRTAIALKKRGIGKGDIITGCSNNHLEASVPIIASIFIGAIPCSLDPSLSFFEKSELLHQVKPKIVFTVEESLGEIKAALKNAELDSEVVVFGQTTTYTEFQEFIQPQQGEEDFQPVVVDDPKDTVVIIFSSGTSGFPKGICLNHYYFYFVSPLVPRAKNWDLDEERMKFELSKREGSSFLNYGSLYWSSGIMGLFLSAVTGLRRLLCNNFDAKEFWYLIGKYQVIGVFLTPFQVTELVKCGKPNDADTSWLLRLSTGGAALSRKYIFALQELLPDTDIIPTYAQTEVGMLTAFQIHNKAHREYYKKNPDTVGLPVRGVWYKVVDPETETVLGPNEPGELRVKSKTVMNGYYNRDFSNRYDKDGWFRTGDIVKYDENGYFYVVDRLKEMLKYRGWHIPPAILELELSHHPAVKRVVVIGKPHEEDGDHPMAVIVLEEDAKDVTAKDIERYVEERVDEKQRLRGGVKFVTSIPMTPSGKIKRRKLRRMVLDGRI